MAHVSRGGAKKGPIHKGWAVGSVRKLLLDGSSVKLHQSSSLLHSLQQSDTRPPPSPRVVPAVAAIPGSPPTEGSARLGRRILSAPQRLAGHHARRPEVWADAQPMFPDSMRHRVFRPSSIGPNRHCYYPIRVAQIKAQMRKILSFSSRLWTCPTGHSSSS